MNDNGSVLAYVIDYRTNVFAWKKTLLVGGPTPVNYWVVTPGDIPRGLHQDKIPRRGKGQDPASLVGYGHDPVGRLGSGARVSASFQIFALKMLLH